VEQFAAREADAAALAAILRLNPTSGLTAETRMTVRDSRVVERCEEVPGGCCGLLSGSVSRVQVVERYNREEVVPSWGWGVVGRSRLIR